MTRFGMDVVLAHPEGYDVMPEVEEIAKKNAEKNGGSFTKTNNMAEAFQKMLISYIRRAGLHLQLWKNVQTFMQKATSTESIN